jgi:hypothetical protein
MVFTVLIQFSLVGMAMGRVKQKLVYECTREIYLNPPAITPVGAIPNPHSNPLGFGWVSSHPCVLNHNSAINN